MKHFHRALGALLLSLLAACFGARARQDVLLPALQTRWEHMRDDVQRELQAQPDTATMVALDAADRALASGDRAALLAVDWSRLEAAVRADADRRVAAGLIGPGVRDSILERLARFQDARASFVGGGL